MWELDHKESWALIDAFELWYWRRVLRAPWTARRPNQSILKETSPEYSLERLNIPAFNFPVFQFSVFFGKLKFQCFAHLMWKNWLIGKDTEKDWRQEEKGTTEDETVGWHHQLDGHEFEQAPGFGERQESLVHCSPWDYKESDMTVWLNWTDAFVTKAKYFYLQTYSPPQTIIFLQVFISKGNQAKNKMLYWPIHWFKWLGCSSVDGSEKTERGK